MPDRASKAAPVQQDLHGMITDISDRVTRNVCDHMDSILAKQQAELLDHLIHRHEEEVLLPARRLQAAVRHGTMDGKEAQHSMINVPEEVVVLAPEEVDASERHGFSSAVPSAPSAPGKPGAVNFSAKHGTDGFAADDDAVDSNQKTGRSMSRLTTMRHKRRDDAASQGTANKKAAAGSHVVVAVHVNCVRAFVKSARFELVSMALIAANTLCNGIEVQVLSQANDPSTRSTFEIIGILFNMAFLIELLLRYYTHGFRICCGPEAGWITFDTIIVCLGLAETIVTTIGLGASLNANMIRVVRIFKITRVLRVVRVLHAFRGLRVLFLSLAHTMKNSFWVLGALVLTLWTTGTIFTFAAFEGNESQEYHEDLLRCYGSLWLSIYTLFAAVFGGIDWDTAVAPLRTLESASVWVTIFMIYISLQYLVLINVIAGVFLHSAMESAFKDHDMVVQELLTNKKQYMSELNKLWARMDKDQSGQLTLEEFEEALQDEFVKTYLEGLGVTVSDAWILFSLLEDPVTRMLEPGAFMDGCLQLNGNARAVDIAALQKDLRDEFNNLMDRFEHLEQHVSGERSRRSGIDAE